MHVRKRIVTDEEHNPVAIQLDYEDWLESERHLGTEPRQYVDLSR